MIFELLPIALAITLEPIPLTAVTLVLGSERGTRKGAMFILGWMLSMAIVVALTLLATGNNPPRPHTAPSVAALAVKLLIGVVLVGIAFREWRIEREPRKPKAPPKWESKIDQMSLWFAFALGPIVQPWGLIAAGSAIIVEAKVTTWQSTIALSLFCIVGTITYVAMELYALLRPAKTRAFVASLRRWVTSHTDQIIIVISLALGRWLIVASPRVLVAT